MPDLFGGMEEKGLSEIIEAGANKRFEVIKPKHIHSPKSVFHVLDKKAGRERALKYCEYDEDYKILLDNEWETWRLLRSNKSNMENIIEICEEPIEFPEDSWGLLMELADMSLHDAIKIWKKDEKKTKKRMLRFA